MLRRLRLLLTAAAFVGCLAISLAAAVAVFRQGFGGSRPDDGLLPGPVASVPDGPTPLAADQELRVLVSEDLSRAPRDHQLAVAARLEQVVRARRDWRPADQELSPQQFERLQENLTELLRVWFLSKADQFAAMETARRAAFLDDLLGLVEALTAMAQSAPRQAASLAKVQSPTKSAAKSAGTSILMNLLAKFQERTTAEEQAKAIALGMALQERRQLRAKKQPAKKTHEERRVEK
jgi:hypothetical protein